MHANATQKPSRFSPLCAWPRPSTGLYQLFSYTYIIIITEVNSCEVLQYEQNKKVCETTLCVFVCRAQDIKAKKHHIPLVDRTPLEPPPIVIVVVGPPKVGKTTLIRCLIKNFTRQKLGDIRGPVTIVSGRSGCFYTVTIVSVM